MKIKTRPISDKTWVAEIATGGKADIPYATLQGFGVTRELAIEQLHQFYLLQVERDRKVKERMGQTELIEVDW